MAEGPPDDVKAAVHGFPDRPDAEVRRENLIATMDDIFKGDVQVLCVEGQRGIGKTTLLAQFARAHASRCVSTFLKPASRLAYSPESIRLTLGEQIGVLLRKPIPSDELPDEGVFRSQLLMLSRRSGPDGGGCPAAC